MTGGGYHAYRQTGVMTADPKKLVVMCYEEAIRSLNSAASSYSSKDYMAKGKAVKKALDIISELREALDFEKGGTIATSLNTLYVFMTSHIIKSDLAKNMKGLQQVASMLELLKPAWEKVFFGYQEESTMSVSNLAPDFKASIQGRSVQSIGYVK
jgi:flagellar protein FliS